MGATIWGLPKNVMQSHPTQISESSNITWYFLQHEIKVDKAISCSAASHNVCFFFFAEVVRLVHMNLV